MTAALFAVTATGAVWALFCVLLWAGGHAPSVALVPIPREDYYLWQAVFVTPLLLAQWLLLSAMAHGTARALGGRGAFRATARGLAFAFALPLVAVFLLPDLLVYLLLGFDSLAAGTRVYGPLAALAVLVSCTSVLRRVHRVSGARAAAAALVGVVAQGLVAGPLLR